MRLTWARRPASPPSTPPHPETLASDGITIRTHGLLVGIRPSPNTTATPRTAPLEIISLLVKLPVRRHRGRRQMGPSIGPAVSGCVDNVNIPRHQEWSTKPHRPGQKKSRSLEQRHQNHVAGSEPPHEQVSDKTGRRRPTRRDVRIASHFGKRRACSQDT